MPGQHDTTPIQTVIYRPNEHADEYIVAIDDVAEVSRVPLIRPHIYLSHFAPSFNCTAGQRVHANNQYEQWKTDKSIALSRFVGQFAIVSHPSFPL